ncbi:hypothetical protein Aab01nite_53710 [Paractinoplanes abujensis]|uniref:PAS domain-containing protein n=1 Tax=Paractinoplanes abujensis TaxID=882441 RepID=A0A7W7CSK6_9ACTN|nr:PAS domain-containing protein [Actinoplanes abujensis]MBB4693559.1 PAS domain-containing protein [Actinoplanes abujensis]GID21781.1 hypothetical protein Aab01nite_53710 [Actinoplanes abujensis]
MPVTVSLRATRFGSGLLLSWRYHDHDRRLAARIDRMQRVADLGWAEWDLVTGRTEWSPLTYEILRRDPHTGPVKLTGLHRYVHPDDVGAFHEAVRAVSREARPVDVRVRFRRHGGSVAVRLIADAVCDVNGRVVAVHGVLRPLNAAGQQ